MSFHFRWIIWFFQVIFKSRQIQLLKNQSWFVVFRSVTLIGLRNCYIKTQAAQRLASVCKWIITFICGLNSVFYVELQEISFSCCLRLSFFIYLLSVLPDGTFGAKKKKESGTFVKTTSNCKPLFQIGMTSNGGHCFCKVIQNHPISLAF